MPLYLIQRSCCRYDEYDAFVIRADTTDDCKAIALARDTDGERMHWRNANVTEIPVEGETEIILGSFNAG